MRPRDLSTGSFCQNCAYAERCPYFLTDHACGDPLTNDDELHPARNRLAHSVPADLAPAPSLRSVHDLPDLIVVEDRSQHRRTKAVRARDALASAGTRRDRLRAPKPDRGVAVLIGNDDLMARIWQRQYTLGRGLVQAGFRSVIGPGFSTYWASNPFVIQTSIQRSASVAAELSRHLPTVPTLVWGCDEDIERQIRWVVASGGSTFAFDLGPLARGVGWDCARRGIAVARSALEALGAASSLVVNGVSSLGHIQSVINQWPWGVTFMTRGPWIQAKQHRVIGPDLVAVDDPHVRSSTAVLTESVFALEAAISEAKLGRTVTAAVATVLAAHAER